ncbi:hypothetical protein SKAU_G00427140 [Synaphobranchus kaupii]|uniref:Ig-like domain-containing protein n=1 Tax=Synaphobranchus kaupii TaxID=118154 RepID=A0A9Q1E4X0_SYNKA|nr:hypothetical protein SKAU_G00427140 [Synaphobranchus kaupii]
MPLPYFLTGDFTSEIVVQSNGNFTLRPNVQGLPEDILWRCDGNKVVEFVLKQVRDYGKFKGRTILDVTTGALTLTHLRESDSGEYMGELQIMGELLYHPQMVKVFDPVKKPKVTCQENSTSVTLLCSGDNRPTTQYSWEGPDIAPQTGSQLKMEAAESSDSVYTCVLKNPVSENRTDFPVKSCFPEPERQHEKDIENQSEENTGLTKNYSEAGMNESVNEGADFEGRGVKTEGGNSPKHRPSGTVPFSPPVSPSAAPPKTGSEEDPIHTPKSSPSLPLQTPQSQTPGDQRQGQEREGQEREGQGQEMEGQEREGQGQEREGQGQEREGQGQEMEGQEREGQGQEMEWQEREGQEREGQEREGQEREGQGQEREGQEREGQGQEMEGQEREGQGQEREGQGQEREGQEREGQGQERQGQEREGQDEGSEEGGAQPSKTAGGGAENPTPDPAQKLLYSSEEEEDTQIQGGASDEGAAQYSEAGERGEENATKPDSNQEINTTLAEESLNLPIKPLSTSDPNQGCAGTTACSSSHTEGNEQTCSDNTPISSTNLGLTSEEEKGSVDKAGSVDEEESGEEKGSVDKAGSVDKEESGEEKGSVDEAGSVDEEESGEEEGYTPHSPLTLPKPSFN